MDEQQPFAPDAQPTPTDPEVLVADADADRLFLARLRAQQPAFTLALLWDIHQQEVLHWALTGRDQRVPTFAQTQQAFGALQHEQHALNELEQALAAHTHHAWTVASAAYARTIGALTAAQADWIATLRQLADQTPFDPSGSLQHDHMPERPLPPSSRELLSLSRLLFRAYQNLDRVLCLGLELTQRLVCCLSLYLEEAEAREVYHMDDPRQQEEKE